MRAFALAVAREPSLRLVLTGSPEPFTTRLLPLIQSLNLPEESVIHLGYVPDEMLAAAYQGAEALVFTSEYEGFGMPVLEAMQAGCPVICAPLTALPEIAGDAALYVDSDDPQAWAYAVLDELPRQREALIAAGYARAELFTWEKTREVWREVIEEKIEPRERGEGSKGDTLTPDPSPSERGEKKLKPDDEEQGRLLGDMDRVRHGVSGSMGKALSLPKLWQIQGRLLAIAQHYAKI
jgi:hypothetical protein